MSDIDTIGVDTLKALDPEWPIREAGIGLLFPSEVPGEIPHTLSSTPNFFLPPFLL